MTPHSVGAEERNIPLRICLTKAEWTAMHFFEAEVHTAVEAVIAAVTADTKLLLQVAKAIDQGKAKP